MSSLTGIALGKNADGRLELVARSDDEGSRDTMWHAWQNASGEWTGWHRFGRPGSAKLDSSPSVIQNGADGHLEVFVTDTHGAVWHRWQTTPNYGWSEEWRSLGKPGGQQATGTPALAPISDRRVAAVVIAGGTVWQASQQRPGVSSDWSGWSSLGRPGGGAANGLAVSSDREGRLEVFSSDHEMKDKRAALWHRRQIAPGGDGWSDWMPLGGPGEWHTGWPVVGQDVDGSLVLLTVAQDNAVWHRWQTVSDLTTWTPWASLGQQGAGFWDVGVALDAIGRLVLVATTQGNDLWYAVQTAPAARTWTSWSLVGTVPVALGGSTEPTLTDPTLLLNHHGRMELFLVPWTVEGLYQLTATEKGQLLPYIGRLWPGP